MGNVYFDEKQRKKRRWILKLKIYGSLSVFFILIIGAGYLIVYSPLFRIKNILILGTSNVPKLEENIKVFFANQSKIDKFFGANNILIWKQEKIGEFLKNEPQIAELTIKKDYFKRLIKIEVKEREKFGIWCANNCFWFDKKGVVFLESPSTEGSLINKIDDFSDRSFNLGDKILEEKFLSNLIKIFEILEKSGLKIKSLKLEDIALQEIITDSSPKIYFSLRIEPNFALAALQSLENIGFEKMEYIDLRVENRAYYKMK
ncbi:MAG: hypothetical protein AAB366_01525 [Patescibacteria group bacterium]